MFCLSLLYIQFLYLEALLRLRHALLLLGDVLDPGPGAAHAATTAAGYRPGQLRNRWNGGGNRNRNRKLLLKIYKCTYSTQHMEMDLLYVLEVLTHNM